MTHVTCDLAVSLDGYAAGPDQTQDQPLGAGGFELHRWHFEGKDDNAAEAEGVLGHGAYVMGRNMFGPADRALDEGWQGWWGPEPPYKAPVFVVTHTAREPLELEGGTTFHFVTEGVEEAVRRATEAAGERTVGVAGGASVVRQTILAGLLDELRVHVAPVVLGGGEPLWQGLEDVTFEPVSGRVTALATHTTYRVVR